MGAEIELIRSHLGIVESECLLSNGREGLAGSDAGMRHGDIALGGGIAQVVTCILTVAEVEALGAEVLISARELFAYTCDAAGGGDR